MIEALISMQIAIELFMLSILFYMGIKVGKIESSIEFVSDSTGAKYGEAREPDSYYICMFQVEREKYVRNKIKKENDK
jgi:hypothetical protein